MSRLLRVLLIAALLLPILPADPAAAQTHNPDALAIASGLDGFAADVLNSLGSFEKLGDVIPLTELSPSAPSALNLGSIFTDLTNALLAQPAYLTSLESLENALEAGLDGVYNGVTVDVGDAAVVDSGSAIDVTFGVSATRTISAPLSYTSSEVVLSGGEIAIQLSATTGLHVRLDKTDAPDFHIVGKPSLAVDANANAAIPLFLSRLGFVEANVTGAYTLDLDINADFQDPDDDGKITPTEWTTTALVDLVRVHVVDDPAGDAVFARFDFDSDLIDGAPDGSLTLTDADLTDGFDPMPDVQLADLGLFRNISANDALAGFGQLTAGLLASQDVGDLRLPFMQNYLGDTFRFAQPVVDFVKQQGDADIVCGTINAVPPGGKSDNFLPGETIYCQAYGLEATQRVSWTLDGTEIHAGPTYTPTVGLNPTQVVPFTLSAGGSPDLRLEFTDQNGGEHTVLPRFNTPQQLFQRLLELGSFDAGATTFNYDTNTKSLVYHLVKRRDPAPFAKGRLDFGNKLQEATNLSGLSDLSGGATIDPRDVELDITLGILLIDGIPNVKDRFYIKTDGALPEFQAGADINSTVDLRGRLGYLDVSIADDGSRNQDVAFEVVPADPNQPLLTVNIDGPGLSYPNLTISNAISVTGLLADVPRWVTPACNATMSARLLATASLNSAPDVSGGIEVDWPNVFDDTCRPNLDTLTVDPKSDFEADLLGFDIDPSIFGKHTDAMTSTLTLTDGEGDFTSTGRDMAGATLKNLSDGSRCVISSFTATTATCDAGLEGGRDNYWEQDDRYEIEGDPLAMLAIILDNLDGLATSLDSLTDPQVSDSAFLKDDLPLIGFSPQDLISQFRDVRRAVGEIRSGAPEALITCGTQDTDPPAGSVNNAAVDDTIYCQAMSPTTSSASAVTWAISGGTLGNNTVHTTDAKTLNTVAVDPSENAEFLVTAPGGIDPDSGFQINVIYSDDSGDHAASFPNLLVPPTLQKLELLLESKLGLPADALAMSVEDVPRPDGTGGAKDLTMRLGYGVCTGPAPNSAIGPCTPVDKTVEPLSIPINLDLTDAGLPDLVGVNGTSFNLEYATRSQLDMGFSLEPTPKVVVLETSGVHLQAGVDASGLNFEANIGPLGLDIGSEAVISGTHTYTVSSSTTLTDTSGVNFIDSGVAVGDTVHNLDNDAFCEVTSVHSAAADTIANENREMPNRVYLPLVTSDGKLTTSGGNVTGASTPTSLTCAGGLSGGHSWDLGERYQIGGGGVARLGVDFALVRQGIDTADSVTSTYTISDFVDHLDAQLDGLAPSSLCSGDMCVSLSMSANVASQKKYLGDIGFTVTDIASPSLTTTGDLTRLQSLINDSPLDWTLLLKALPELTGYVTEQLDGASSDVSVPVIGDTLDAGANVAGELKDVADKLLELETQLADLPISDAGELTSGLETLLEVELNNSGVPLLELDGGQNVKVTAYCDADDTLCDDDDSVADIEDIRVTFKLGQTAIYTVPLDLGIPGVPLRVGGTAKSNADWHLLVDFGLNRTQGPYVVAFDNTDLSESLHSDEPELGLRASVGIAEASHGTKDDCAAGDPFTAGDKAPFDEDLEYSDGRCIIGILGFLQVTLRDGDDIDQSTPEDTDQPTDLGLGVGLDILAESDDAIGRIGFRELTAGSAGLALIIDADANVDWRFRTGLADNEIPGFPSVAGAFHLEWARGWSLGISETVPLTTPLTITFDNLHLDAGSFASQFLSPVASEVKKVTGPFMPVIETVRAPLPVLSDLSRMTGGEDITLIELMKASTDSDLTMIDRVMEFIIFVDTMPDPADGPVWISLGGVGQAGKFTVDAVKALKGAPSPGTAKTYIKNAVAATSQQVKDGLKDAKTEGNSKSVISEKTFTTGGLSFPFLQDPSQIFALLMGEDIVLVYYDAGTMRATAGVSYIYRFAVGPVPMSVTLAGSATIEGRFAIGYDTYGLRQVVDGASAANLLNGIFIDDLDANGNDVAEIRLIGTVSAYAAIDLVIVSAGVGGGIELTVELDLDDRPNPDGKLRIEEIYNKLDNPWCLFVVSGKLEAFLEAFVKINFFFFSKTYTFELARITLLEFSAACEPPKPELADKDGINLVLNIGRHAPRRKVATNVEDEEIVVRQLNITGTLVSVAAFGIYQEYELDTGAKIRAYGDSDNDRISFEPGTERETDNPIPFTIDVEVHGGDGNDKIRTGNGNDRIYGENGADQISAGGGNDMIEGGPGNDAVDGSFGDDQIYGGGDDDRLNGGPGADRVYGEEGDDTLAGGPGSNKSESEPGNSPDLGDWLYGGPGRDSLQGDWGDDWLYGDDDLGANANAACDSGGEISADGLNVDQLGGSFGDDKLFGGHDADEVEGGPGNDLVCGNAGNDRLNGDDEDPALDDGNDTVKGGPGNDLIHGRGGNDILSGGAEDDDLLGGDGRDVLDGDGGNDLLVADTGSMQGHEPLSHTLAVSIVAALVRPINAEAVGDALVADCTSTTQPASPVAGEGNADCLYGGTGTDVLFGEGGHDRLFGEGGGDYMDGNRGMDYMEGNAGDDFMRGGQDRDEMYGNEDADTMFGDSGPDLMHGNDGEDRMRGGMGKDEMFGDADKDEMFGDADEDRMFGNAGDDYMLGNAGDDHMEGNDNVDTMFGNTGQDDMIGGSSVAGAPDDRDNMQGNEDQDVMLGDNGTIIRDESPQVDPADGTVIRQVTLFDLADGNGDTPASGNDNMEGNDGNDDMYGGGEGDAMRGNAGDDYMEGNGAGDWIYGDEDQDDLIGGTSQGSGSQPDGGDHIYGGNGSIEVADRDYDVILGDNAAIARPVADGSGQWIVNTFNAAIARSITLFDIATATHPEADVGFSGDDFLYGEASDDILYGQGANDTMFGGGGDDYMEGNAGVDTMDGEDDNDDMIGGTGRINDDPLEGVDGRLDAGDIMTGSLGFDFMAGDNAVIARTLVEDQWAQNTYNAGIRHERIWLRDVASTVYEPGADTSGPEQMWGNEEDDVMYGQGGDDQMAGGGGQDYMEGNAANDQMAGDPGQDDMIGGTGRINDDPPEGINGRHDGDDWMYGESGVAEGTSEGEGADVMLGDNGLIGRPLDGNGQWTVQSFNGDFVRAVILLDVATVTTGPAAAAIAGSDHMWGNDNDDQLFGQAEDDELYGNAGVDYMEGNHDADTLYGGGSEDDMTGGGSANDGVIDADRIGDGLLDTGDLIFGDDGDNDPASNGDDGDVMAGDNARLSRPLGGDGLWVTDPNTGDALRDVLLFDIEIGGGATVDPASSGSDTMWGEGGRDFIFGQGNDNHDADDDGHFSEDPADGIDNDRDGRESTASVLYDCLDGADNDDDGQADSADPECQAAIDEDGGGDEMHGGEGDDVMEGNHGSDWMFGGAGEDDMWGGNSAGQDGLVGSGSPPTHLQDGDDIMSGGGEDDVMLADNGLIVRMVDGGGLWQVHSSSESGVEMTARDVTVSQTPEHEGAFGNDHQRGDGGEDELYGQQGDDLMEGNDGQDAMVGDLGKVTSSVEDGSRTAVIAPPGPFFEETIHPVGSFYRMIETFSFLVENGAAGNDTMLGGDNRDSIHGGPGDDIMNGDGDAPYPSNPIDGTDTLPETVDSDRMMGGDGDDAMWGGRGDDYIWGGWGEDHLDVRPRPATEDRPADPPTWFTYGRTDHYQGLDLIYGGWDRDALQANVAAPGPRDTDRLIDWAGGYNVFYVCNGAYGEGTITREGSPHLRDFLRQLIDAGGAFTSASEGTSGFRELSYVFPNERGANSHPPHPDHPGHFICDDGSVFVGPDGAETPEVPPEPPPAPANTLHVGQLVATSDAGKNNNFWTAHVVTTVHDQRHNPFADAEVTGVWDVAADKSVGCTTDATGSCTVTQEDINRSTSSVTFSITDVQHALLTYTPADNHSDSDATEVTAASLAGVGEVTLSIEEYSPDDVELNPVEEEVTVVDEATVDEGSQESSEARIYLPLVSN